MNIWGRERADGLIHPPTVDRRLVARGGETRRNFQMKCCLPAEQTSDQCVSLQCWVESLDSLRSAAGTRTPAGKKTT